MSDYERCQRCHEFDWVKTHTCNRYEINSPDYDGNEWQEIWARDMETAAKRWAEEFDQYGDYRIVGQQSEPIVHVRDGDVCKTFQVSGEAIPKYYAEEIEAAP